MRTPPPLYKHTPGMGPPPADPMCVSPPHPPRGAEWISIDKDETAGGKGKMPPGARANQDYAK